MPAPAPAAAGEGDIRVGGAAPPAATDAILDDSRFTATSTGPEAFSPAASSLISSRPAPPPLNDRKGPVFTGDPGKAPAILDVRLLIRLVTARILLVIPLIRPPINS